MDETDSKLRWLQEQLVEQFGMKIDLYREERKGVLAVPHGMDLIPQNVIYVLSDYKFLNL